MRLLLYLLLPFCFLIGNTSTTIIYAQQHHLTPGEADSIANKADQVYNQGNYKEAWLLYRKAMQTYKTNRDTLRWLKHAFPYAEVQVDLGRYSEALKLLEKIRNINHPYISTAYKARLYNDFGWANKKTGNYDTAEAKYTQALDYARRANDSTEIAILYSNMGSLHTEQANYDRAINYLEKALQLNREMDRRFGIAINLNNLGHAYVQLSLYSKGIEYYRNSIEIRKELDRPDLLAVAYNNLAIAQKEVGNYSRSLITYEKALKLMREYSSQDEIAKTLNNIGSLYENLNDIEKAASYYHKSLRKKKKHNSPQSIAITLNKLGDLYSGKSEYDSASHYYRASIELNKDLKNNRHLAISYLNLSDLEERKGQYQTAISFAQKALENSDVRTWPKLSSNIQLQFGDIYYELGEFDKSLQHNREGYALVDEFTPRHQIGALKELANTYYKVNRDSAYHYAEMAVAYIEQARAGLGASSVLSARSFSSHTNFYKVLAIWYLRAGINIDRAYELIELSKARSLNEQLTQTTSINKLDSTRRQKLIRKQQLGRDISRLSRTLETTDSIEKKNALQQKLNDKELEFHALLSQIDGDKTKPDSPDKADPISLSRTQARCGANDAVVQFAVTEKHTALIVVTQEQVDTYIHKHDASRTKLAESVDSYRNDIIEHQPRKQLAESSKRIIENVLNALFISSAMEKDHWIIAADGPLAYLPFEALIYEGSYLVEKYTISYIPSLTSFKYLPDKRSSSFSKDLLAVASADFSQNQMANAVTRQDYYTLPSTLKEVDSISAGFDQVSKLKRAEVTEEHIKNLPLQEYRYIHFATHGIYDENNPMLSRLLLTTNQPLTALSKEDGFLHVSEISDMQINADMVVLSACNTGVGSLISGEGIMGMQRAFFTAGASTVVVSLWNVFDRSTATLMNYFYENLQQSTSEARSSNGFNLFSFNTSERASGKHAAFTSNTKAQALRAAKKKMLTHPIYNHPVYWAPFIVVGK